MTAARIAGLLLALALVPSCRFRDNEFNLIVSNTGSEPAIVYVDINDDDLDVFTVQPGKQLLADWHHVFEVDVFITRSSDGEIIYAASLDDDDLDDDDESLFVTVSP